MYVVESETVYIDVYKKICEAVINDEHIKAYENDIVFDFDFFDNSSNAVPPKIRDVPRMYLLPQSLSHTPESSCGGVLHLDYNFVIEGFHFLDKRLHKIAWRLLLLLSYYLFSTIQIDGRTYHVKYVPGSGSWDYDSEKRTMSHSLGFSLEIRAI